MYQGFFDPTKLNYSQVPYIPWKGKSFNQITSSLQHNSSSEENMAGVVLFRATPLKIYRKEIATAKVTNYNPRISQKIDEINAPGGYLVKPEYACPNTEGIIGTLDVKQLTPFDQNGQPNTCKSATSDGVCLDKGLNALRRVRSAGMIRNKTNANQNVEPYCTTSQQYLNTRGRTFDQSQFNYLRKGNPLSKPGTNASKDNEYAVNTNINYCTDTPPNHIIHSYYKPNNPQFAQEGAVSSSARIARLNYTTITSNGALYTKAYGSQVGNAMSYGVASDAYTVKAKIGYPNICVPRFSNIVGEEGFKKCEVSPLNNNAFVPGPLNI